MKRGLGIKIKTDRNFFFENFSKKQTNYISHGYHKYPAKFIPQLVDKLIDSYSEKGDTVLDCFGGCGTTLVESKVKERNSIALDINKAAILITRAKKNAINPKTLENHNKKLLDKFKKINVRKNYYKKTHPRLKDWFKEQQYNKLMEIFLLINKEKRIDIKTFYKCCFSNILKNCSIWYSKSIKPMKDFGKQDYDPIKSFIKHLNYMTIQNLEYYNLLKNLDKVNNQIRNKDARKTGLDSNSIDLIITSPPYATSYEYADIHQLTLLWFSFTKDMNKTKKTFIGTTSNLTHKNDTESFLANRIIKALSKNNKNLSKQIARYYYDLNLTFKEMYRVLKNKKPACIIIGDTQYKNVKIRNMEVSVELLRKIGFNVEKVIKRKLSCKTFTPYRDETGKFTDSSHGKKREIYQYEYIIIARKLLSN